MVTIKTFENCGPYFPTVRTEFVATNIWAFVSVVRALMEEGNADLIGVFEDDKCKGIWHNDAEPEPDGEGGWDMPTASYALARPSERFFWTSSLQELN